MKTMLRPGYGHFEHADIDLSSMHGRVVAIPDLGKMRGPQSVVSVGWPRRLHIVRFSYIFRN